MPQNPPKPEASRQTTVRVLTWNVHAGVGPDGTGLVITDVGGGFDEIHALAVQPDGKILAAGRAALSGARLGDFGLVRYLPDGRLDESALGDEVNCQRSLPARALRRSASGPARGRRLHDSKCPSNGQAATRAGAAQSSRHSPSAVAGVA